MKAFLKENLMKDESERSLKLLEFFSQMIGIFSKNHGIN